jgi:hypothetical protein
MRALLLTTLVACGGNRAAAPATNTSSTEAASSARVAALPPMPPCEARTAIPDGFHDRYMFRDEATEKQGFKDASGKVVIPARFIDVYPFTPGGLAAVTDGTTPFAFIDVSGKVFAKAYAFDNGPDYYQEGFARVVAPDGRVGYVSETSGRIEIAAKYTKAHPFCDGKAEVELDGQRFQIDRLGNRLP